MAIGEAVKRGGGVGGGEVPCGRLSSSLPTRLLATSNLLMTMKVTGRTLGTSRRPLFLLNSKRSKKCALRSLTYPHFSHCATSHAVCSWPPRLWPQFELLGLLICCGLPQTQTQTATGIRCPTPSVVWPNPRFSCSCLWAS